MTAARYRPTPFGKRRLVLERETNGIIRARTDVQIDGWATRLSDRFVHWAAQRPDRIFAAKRGADGQWRTITWARALQFARSIGQALIDRGLSAERPVVILSDNDLEHLMLILGAQYAGVAYASVSQAYSLVSQDHAKLKHIVRTLTPGLVFAAHGEKFARAIAAAIPAETEVIVTEAPIAGRPCGLWETFANTPATPAVDAAREKVGPDTIQKFLFTSGSTSAPKGVVNTERMVCANQAMVAYCSPALAEDPVFLDWLPWSHTFGGNQTIGLVIHNGGTLYIDDGKPTPALFHRTLANLREIQPTVYFNVPKGFEALAEALAADDAFAKHFFAKLKMMFYAGAGLSQPVWDSLEATAERVVGERIVINTGLGMTETAPSCLFTDRADLVSGDLGMPCPGVELKLVPSDDKMEVRYRGPNVMPGYWRNPEANAKAFDEEGFFCTGDAIKFVDPANPDLGFRFDGRIAEDFKLATGTWVSVGPLRQKVISVGDPYIQDIVVCGLNRDEMGVMVFPHLEPCRALAGLGADATVAQVLGSAEVRAFFTDLITKQAAQSTGSANRIARALLLIDPPSIDLGEVTDKGSINQRAVLAHRADKVEALYDDANPEVLKPAA